MIAPAPIVVGVGRSGTTLLRLMLDAHPELAIPSETHFLAGMLNHPPEGGEAFVATLIAAHTWNDFHLNPRELSELVAAKGQFDLAEAVRTFYLMYADRFGKTRWGDKSPPYVRHMEPLFRLLPEARFVHMIRDGRDVALSYRGKWFGPARMGIEAAAVFWKETILGARAVGARLPAGTYTETRFEDLLAWPQTSLRRICGVLDLPWDATMLDYHENAAQRLDEMGDRFDGRGNVLVSKRQRLSIHHHTNAPPDLSQAGKWRTALSRSEIDTFHRVAGGLLGELGYDV